MITKMNNRTPRKRSSPAFPAENRNRSNRSSTKRLQVYRINAFHFIALHISRGSFGRRSHLEKIMLVFPMVLKFRVPMPLAYTESPPMADEQPTEYLSCAEAGKLAPGRPAACTVWRWATKGTETRQGKIKLQHVRMGGKIFTSAQWLKEFSVALAAANEPVDIPPPPTPQHRSSAQRLRAIEDAKRELGVA